MTKTGKRFPKAMWQGNETDLLRLAGGKAAERPDPDARIVFMGSPEFALPALAMLLEEAYQLVGIATQPDRPVGRRQTLTPTPVRAFATEHQLPVYTWESLKTAQVQAELAALQPTILITAAYGLLLPQAVLDLAPRGAINLHPSLLPRWRGASPVAAAILQGDRQSGVSLYQMDKGLDTGPLLGQLSMELQGTETTPQLTAQLAEKGAALLRALLPAILRGDLRAQPQTGENASYAPKLNRAMGLLDFQARAAEVEARIRAFTPWPGTSAWYGQNKYKILSVRLLPQEIWPQNPTAHRIGEVWREGKELYVQCSDAPLQLEELGLPSGKRALAREISHAFPVGQCFSPVSQNTTG